MLAHYRNGCLQKSTRKDGAERWQFRWLEKIADGTSRERKKTIGLVKDYPEHSKRLQDLLAGLRLNISTDGPTKLTSVTMTAAVEHYMLHELADNGAEGKAYSTRKTLVLKRWGPTSMAKPRSASHQDRRGRTMAQDPSNQQVWETQTPGGRHERENPRRYERCL